MVYIRGQNPMSVVLRLLTDCGPDLLEMWQVPASFFFFLNKTYLLGIKLGKSLSFVYRTESEWTYELGIFTACGLESTALWLSLLLTWTFGKKQKTKHTQPVKLKFLPKTCLIENKIEAQYLKRENNVWWVDIYTEKLISHAQYILTHKTSY